MSGRGVFVLGSINTDLVVRGRRLPRPGETVVGGEFFEAPGGKGANQAVAAASRAETVTMLAAVGDDPFGHDSRVRLQAEGIRCDFIKLAGGQPTGVALILVDDLGENLISVASGANLALDGADVDAIPEAVLRNVRAFLACLESPWEVVLRGLERAKAMELTTILNPAPAREDVADAAWLKFIDVITPNEHEAALLTGVDPNAQGGAQRAAQRLIELGCGACVVTMGARGALVVEGNGHPTRLPARQVKAVDATAAGDAFNGALAVALAEGRSLVDAARWACSAAAISVTRQGAQPSLPTRAEIETFYAASD